MKRLLLFIVGMSMLFSCEYLNGPTTINREITSQYLLTGNLDVYFTNYQVFRYKGKPGIVTIPIGNADLLKYENCFVLHVATGTTQATTVSSAIIKLDDLEVLNTSDFSKNAGQFSFEVCNLTPTSVIIVELRGEPGSYLDIWIEGKLKELRVNDVDGNKYTTVKICDQIWMVENLKTTKYKDGTEIPNIINGNDWGALTTGAYCWYNNDPSYKDTYGALYNGYTVTTGKLCPDGWHVPTQSEWHTLALCLDASSILSNPESLTAGGMLKESGTLHWANPNIASNSSGFTALPGGYRNIGDGSFNDLTGHGWLWSSTEISSEHLYIRWLEHAGSNLDISDNAKNYGGSVRCIKDN
jgi:uncharacterized protein (TIGR02145 family)